MSNFYYAGIGARATPKEILFIFTQLGRRIAAQGGILRSGGAEGADSAFEEGADNHMRGVGPRMGGNDPYKEIYLPWNGFNNRYTNQNGNILMSSEAIALARADVPGFDSFKHGV